MSAGIPGPEALAQPRENVLFVPGKNIPLTLPSLEDAGRTATDDQGESDRLVTLKKASRKVITQRQAAEELEVSIGHVRRLLAKGSRGWCSNPRTSRVGLKPEDQREIEQQAVRILSAPVYAGFGPTLASEYLGEKHGMEASKETVGQWMIRAGLWKGRQARIRQVTHMAAAPEPTWRTGAGGHQ